jgi:hypothetical protein
LVKKEGSRMWFGLKYYGSLFVVLALALWWFNLSPPAKSCFAAGGTQMGVDGTCIRVVKATVKY